MVVSIDWPPAMAQMEELPPRWQLTSFGSQPSISRTRPAMNWCEAP